MITFLAIEQSGGELVTPAKRCLLVDYLLIPDGDWIMPFQKQMPRGISLTSSGPVALRALATARMLLQNDDPFLRSRLGELLQEYHTLAVR